MPLNMPINSKRPLRNQFSLDIFPSLEEIVVCSRTLDTPIDEKESASVLESFRPFVTARHQVDRPVKVFWSADGEVLRYFMPDPWAMKGN